MARYVVLSFDNNEAAEGYCAAVQSGDAVVNEFEREAKVVALVPKPTKFCDNSDGHKSGKTQSGWTKGIKLGWWICAKCKKPTKLWGESYQSVIAAATNLLPNVEQTERVHVWDLDSDAHLKK